MLNRLLQYNYSVIGIFFFMLFVKLGLYLTGQLDSGAYDASIFDLFSHSSFWGVVLAALAPVLLGLLLLRNSEQYAKRNDFSYWLVLFFCLLFGFHSYYSFSLEYLGLTAFLWSFAILSKGLENKVRTQYVADSFNLSFVLALGTFFTPHLIFLWPFFGLGRLVLGIPSWRSFVVSVLGYILPFIIVDTFIFVFWSDVFEYTHRYFLDQFQTTGFHHHITFHSWEQLALVGPLLMLLMGLYVTFKLSYSYKTVIRKFNTINILLLLYLLLLSLIGFLPTHWASMLFFVPASYFFSNFQSQANARWRTIYVSFLLISAFLSYPPVMEAIVEGLQTWF